MRRFSGRSYGTEISVIVIGVVDDPAIGQGRRQQTPIRVARKAGIEIQRIRYAGEEAFYVVRQVSDACPLRDGRQTTAAVVSELHGQQKTKLPAADPLQ